MSIEDTIKALTISPKFFFPLIYNTDTITTSRKVYSTPLIPRDDTLADLVSAVLAGDTRQFKHYNITRQDDNLLILDEEQKPQVLKIVRNITPEAHLRPQAAVNLSPELNLATIAPVAVNTYLSTDRFTNDVLINYLLHLITSEHQLPRCYLHYSYVKMVHDYGVILEEYANLGTLDRLPADWLQPQATATGTALQVPKHTLQGILAQVAMALWVLRQHGVLSHTGLTFHNIFLQTGTYQYRLGPYPFLCKLSRFENASCQYNNLRIYAGSNFSDQFVPVLLGTKGDSYTVDSLVTTLGRLRLAHIGFPLYQSLDYTTFLVSLALDPRYGLLLTDQELLQTYWYPVFGRSAGQQLAQKLQGQHVANITFQTVINNLFGYQIRYTALETIINKIQR